MLGRQRPNPEAAKCANAQKKKMKRSVTFCPSDIDDSDITLLIQMLRFNHRSKTEPMNYAPSRVLREPGKGSPKAVYIARKKKLCPAEVRQVLYH